MALNVIRPAIGSDGLLAATAHALEPRVVPGSSGLPAGFPASLDTQLAWTGKQFKNDESYVYRLSADEIAEAESSLQYFKCECPLSSGARVPPSHLTSRANHRHPSWFGWNESDIASRLSRLVMLANICCVSGI